jgi:hypothetical protein
LRVFFDLSNKTKINHNKIYLGFAEKGKNPFKIGEIEATPRPVFFAAGRQRLVKKSFSTSLCLFPKPKKQ